jgi:hypothetical protein
MADGDWKDPKAQDRIAKYKVQEYFDKFQSWDAVSVAWFAGENKAKELLRNGTIDYDKADSNGTTIRQYVDSMNNLIAEDFMTMELPMETITIPQIYAGPQRNPVIDKQRKNQEVFAAQILDAMTRANADGNRPTFESQVPSQAGDFAEAVAETKVRRGEIR